MECHCGADYSLERSSLCVVDATSSIVREATVTSRPGALIAWFLDLDLPLGLEAGPPLQRLYAGLTEAGFFVGLITTRQGFARAAYPFSSAGSTSGMRHGRA